MAFCPNCGASVESGTLFCSSCGANLQANNNAPFGNAQTAYNAPQPKSRELNVAQLVWAIINTLFTFMPLGIVALVFTITAKDSPDDETEAKRLKNAKLCNIIATAIGAAAIVFSIILVVVYFVFVMGIMGVYMY